MSTKLLYYDDDHMTSFEARVVAIDEESRTVVLDATAFYPTGGHQHCDQGRIQVDRKNYLIVTEVSIDDEGTVAHHYVASKGHVAPGDEVVGSVQQDRRLHHMQLHTAQHILSRCAADRFDAVTGHADFSPDGGFAVLSPAIDWQQAMVLEDDVNGSIRAARKVTRRIDAAGVVTIAVDGVDESQCGGTHVTSTDQIDMFKITRLDGKTVYYDTGIHAKRDARRQASHALEAASFLGVADTRGLLSAVTELSAAHKSAAQQLDEWCEDLTQRQVRLAHQRAQRLGGNGVSVMLLDLSHLGAKAARELLKQQLTDPDQVWLCLAAKRSILVSSAADGVAAREVVDEFSARWGIRGGGGLAFAQVGPVPEDVGVPLEDVVNWLQSQHTTAASGCDSTSEDSQQEKCHGRTR